MKTALNALANPRKFKPDSAGTGPQLSGDTEREHTMNPALWISHESSDFISVNALLRRGWTRLLIKTWLGQPDRRVIQDSAPTKMTMRLFRRERVEQAEADPAFAQHLRKSLAHRVVGSRSGTERRESQILKHAQSSKIAVPRLANRKLRTEALAYAAKQPDTGQPVEQLELNYLLNELIEFDQELFNLSGLPNLRRASWIYRCRIFKEITNVYPHLTGECERSIGLSNAKLSD